MPPKTSSNSRGKGVLKKPAAKKPTVRQGLTLPPQGIERLSFDISEFIAGLENRLGLLRLRGKPFKMATGCSGFRAQFQRACAGERGILDCSKISRILFGKLCEHMSCCLRIGAVRWVLDVIADNLQEITASEIDPEAAHVMLLNTQANPPMQLHTNIFDQNEHGTGFDYVSGRMTKVIESESLDLFIAGYPCNTNSNLNPARYAQDATESCHAAVLPECAARISYAKPKCFVLENVAAVMNRRGGSSGKANESVLAWVNQVLSARVGSDYTWFSVHIDSMPLLLADD